MDLGLSGKCAVVGASSAGLGFATAKALAEEGARVLLTGRDAGRLAHAVATIGEPATGLVADLSTPEAARDLVSRATDELGGIDILVANVGGPAPGVCQAPEFHRETVARRAAGSDPALARYRFLLLGLGLVG